MSEAAPAIDVLFSINACSHCHAHIPKSASHESRHAIPCGHVLCGACTAQVVAEQKARERPVCSSPGCGATLGPAQEFVTAWCTQRAERIRSDHSQLFADQGNVGDSGAAADDDEEAKEEPSPNTLCSRHREPITARDTASKKPLCAKCILTAGSAIKVTPLPEAIAELVSRQAAASAAASRELFALFDKFTFTAATFRDGVAKWGEQETGRISSWEKQEIDHIHKVAADITSLVRAACARRLAVGSSILAQRYGLRATLEEIEHELCNLPSNEAGRLSRMQLLSAERERLTDLLSARALTIPSVRAFSSWAKLPNLAAQFGSDEKHNDQCPVKTLRDAAAEILIKLRESEPESGTTTGLPILPSFVSRLSHAQRVSSCNSFRYA